MPGRRLTFYDDVAALERYLKLPAGSLRQIPIYARVPAVDAIIKVKEMEASSLFRPGLYYTVLADLVGNTTFNAKYGNAEGDVRTQWFHTCVIGSLGQIDLENHVAFSKTIEDASLLVLSAFGDVYRWPAALDKNLASMTAEYTESLEIRGVENDEDTIEARLNDFAMKARRLVHLGEVSYADRSDPLSLALSQTFTIGKEFAETQLGRTQPEADAIRPTLSQLGSQSDP